jgi:hypothetical protein
MPRKAALLRKSAFQPNVEQLESRELLNATPVQLVNRLYSDLLDRQPDIGGLSFWSNQLAGGQQTNAVAARILGTNEALGKLVDSRFQLILGRAVDPAARSFFTQTLQAGTSITGLDASLYSSAEFTGSKSAGDDGAFVNAVFTSALGRSSDAKSRDYFAGLLSSGSSRFQVSQLIAGSREGQNQAVDGWYQQYLHRPADAPELNSWTGQLQVASGLPIIAGILGSPEYGALAAKGATSASPLPPGTSRPLPLPILAVAPDAGSAPLVKVYDAETGEFRFQFFAYDQSFLGGVRIAEADLNRDEIPEIITAPGPGMAPEIRVFDGVTGTQFPGPLGSFLAYDASFLGGVFVAAGEVNGDFLPDIVVAPGAGGGSTVKVFNGIDASLVSSFQAYDNDFASDVHVALLGLHAQTTSEIVTAPGAGAAPVVHVFDGLTGQQVAGPLGSFVAYEPGFLGGVNVAGGGRRPTIPAPPTW